MTKKRKDKKDRHPPDSGSDAKADGRRRKPRGRWMATHGSDLRFLAIFAVLMTGYYILTTFDFVEKQCFPWYLRTTAQISTAALHTIGFKNVERDGNRLTNPDGSISVERGCDAIAPTALFLSAVLASPAGFKFKWKGVLLGFFILMVVNIIRVMTLFLTRVYWHKMFDVMHLDIWQGLFILLAIVLWALWATWATNQEKAQKAQHDAAT